jgi:hypothetical protein
MRRLLKTSKSGRSADCLLQEYRREKCLTWIRRLHSRRKTPLVCQLMVAQASEVFVETMGPATGKSAGLRSKLCMQVSSGSVVCALRSADCLLQEYRREKCLTWIRRLHSRRKGKSAGLRSKLCMQVSSAYAALVEDVKEWHTKGVLRSGQLIVCCRSTGEKSA